MDSNSNAGGYAGAVINYGGVSPSEALLKSAEMNSREKERKQQLAIQQAKLQSDNRLKNVEYDQNLGKDFKPLPGQLQDIASEQLKAIQDKYSDPKYLDLDPATYQTMVSNDTKALAQAHDNAYNGAQQFEQDFQRFAADNPTIPKAQAYQMGMDRFINNHMTYDPNSSKLTFMPPQHTNDENIVNDYLSHPDVIGQMNVPIDPLLKNGKELPMYDVGGTHSFNDKGHLQEYTWSGRANDFMQQTTDPKTGLPTGYELKYKPLPGVTDPRTGQEAKVPTDDYMQQLLSTRDGQNAYYKMRNITKQLVGDKVDGSHLDDLTKAAIYDQQNSTMKSYVNVKQKETIPAAKTVNNFNMGSTPTYDLHTELVNAAKYFPDGAERPNGSVPLTQVSQAGRDLALSVAKKTFGDKVPNSDDPQSTHTLTYADLDYRYKDGALYVRLIQKDKNGNEHLGGEVPISEFDANSVANNSVKQKEARLKQGDATAPNISATTKPTATTTNTTIIPKGHVR